jgi:BolA protein
MTIQNAIKNKLKDQFDPYHLEVVNESGNHNVPAGSESHFKVLMVTPVFTGKTLIARHRLVNHTLAEELSGPVHALSLKLFSPEQWKAAGEQDDSVSPPCAHKR